MGTWLIHLLPIILLLVCAFFLADQMNLESAMKKVADAHSPQKVSLEIKSKFGCQPLTLLTFAGGVWSMFAYRLWYVGLGLPIAVFFAATYILVVVPLAVLVAAGFIAVILEELWQGFHKDRVKLTLTRQRERYAKAGDTEKEGELAGILDSWDVPSTPPAPPSAPPAGAPISIGARPAEEKVGMRKRLQRLENAKDAVVELLESETQLDEDAKKTWVSGAKEVYYTTFAASQALTRGAPSPERAASSGQILGAARSRMERAASELKELKDERAVQLEAELRAAFEDCWQALCAVLPAPPAVQDINPSYRWSAFFEHPVELQPQPEKEQLKPPERSVIKVNDRRYELSCSVCGETAAVWEIGIFKFGGAAVEEKELLLYHGIATGTQFDLAHTSKIFKWLDEGKIAKVHAYTREQELLEFGIDAYCPKCDQILCGTHYQKMTEWDGSWYDCTYGTCPRGHRRMIDD